MLKDDAEAAKKKLQEPPVISSGDLFPDVKIQLEKATVEEIKAMVQAQTPLAAT